MRQVLGLLFRHSNPLHSTQPTQCNIPSLKHFIQRARVLSLWRDALRQIRLIEDPKAKSEMLGWVRGELERNRNVEDITQIRYLISMGRKSLGIMASHIAAGSRRRY